MAPELAPFAAVFAGNCPLEAVRERPIHTVSHTGFSLRCTPNRMSIFGNKLDMVTAGARPLSLRVEDLTRGVSKLPSSVIGRLPIPTTPVGPTVVDAIEQSLPNHPKQGVGLRLESGTTADNPQRTYVLAEGEPP